MPRRVLIVLAVGLVLVAPAAGDDLPGKKHAIDTRLAQLNDHVASVRQRETSLRAELNTVTNQIRSLEAQVGDVSSQLDALQEDLGLHQQRLAKLNELFALRTSKLEALHAQLEVATERLNQRLVDIYESEQTDAIGVVLASQSFDSMLDQADYISEIGRQDKKIAAEVRASRDQVKIERLRTKTARRVMFAETQAIAVRTQQKRAYRDQLAANGSALAAARDQKRVSLDSLTAQERAEAEEIDALQQESAAVAAAIAAAQARSGSGSSEPSSSPGGYQWPVSGPVTSPFGSRWGRMHEGIDIAVPTGTPVHASAAGTVIYASWMSGYGNFVIVDHGGGVATAYGHNSSLAVAVGQQVSQGQVIAYSGSTGHSTGPHVHFEVRVNGAPVDPLGYL